MGIIVKLSGGNPRVISIFCLYFKGCSLARRWAPVIFTAYDVFLCILFVDKLNVSGIGGEKGEDHLSHKNLQLARE